MSQGVDMSWGTLWPLALLTDCKFYKINTVFIHVLLVFNIFISLLMNILKVDKSKSSVKKIILLY